MSAQTPQLVLVTDKEYQRAEAVFTSTPGLRCVSVSSEEEVLAAEIRRTGARYVVVGGALYKGALYEALPRGGVVARFGVGHDGIDKSKATEAGVLCTNTPSVLDQSVAELTMAMIVGAARHVPRSAAEMREGIWKQHVGLELDGKTLAVIGCGRIGQAVGRIASLGFGMRIAGYRRPSSRDTSLPPHFERVSSDFASVVGGASFVSLHMPASAENAQFMSADRIARMAPGAWLVNTARGAVLDEAALFDALSTGRIGGAVLDVFQEEPYVPVDPSRDLRRLTNVILLPHIGSHTFEANRRMAERALGNILRIIAGQHDGLDLLNPQVLG